MEQVLTLISQFSQSTGSPGQAKGLKIKKKRQLDNTVAWPKPVLRLKLVDYIFLSAFVPL